MKKQAIPLNSVKAVSLIGSASILTIAFGLLKMKVAALLLGPAGVGLIGLFQQLMNTVSTLFGLGIREAGTRQVADANENRTKADLVKVRRTLFWSAVSLGLLAALALFLARDLIAQHIIQNPLKGPEIGWLAVGAALTVAAASQQAQLNGLRRIRELALITVLTGALSTVIAIAAMFLWRDYAVIIFVLTSPLATFVMGHVFVARLPTISVPQTPHLELTVEFFQMARLGASIMLAALVVAVGYLVVRTLIQRELGAEALGQFTAAWLISQYLTGFLYSAIMMDYFPRLTAAFSDRAEAERIINQQTEIGLLFAVPLFLGVMWLAPYALWLLYTEEFVEASGVLRWFILGDILKTLAYPLSFVLIAAGAGKTFLLSRLASIITFVFTIWVILPHHGLHGSGIAYLFMNVIYLAAILVLVQPYLSVRLSYGVIVISAVAFASSAIISLLAMKDIQHVLSLGGMISVIAAGYSVCRLNFLTDAGCLQRGNMIGRNFISSFRGLRVKKPRLQSQSSTEVTK